MVQVEKCFNSYVQENDCIALALAFTLMVPILIREYGIPNGCIIKLHLNSN